MNRREFLVAGLAAAPLARCARLPVVAAREPLALATADTQAHVVAVSLATHRVVRRVHTIEGPRCSHAFVTDSGSGELAVIDLRRGRVVRRVEVGALARHVTVDPAGRRLWISLGSSASAIAVVDIADPLRPRVVRTIRPPFLVHDVGFSPSGRRVWLTAGRDLRLAIYRADGHGPVRLMRGDLAPQHITFGPALAYVASGEGRSLHVHSLSDGRLLRAVRIPIGSYNVQRGAGIVLTPSLNTGALTFLDGHGRQRASPRVAVAAHDACVIS